MPAPPGPNRAQRRSADASLIVASTIIFRLHLGHFSSAREARGLDDADTMSWPPKCAAPDNRGKWAGMSQLTFACLTRHGRYFASADYQLGTVTLKIRVVPGSVVSVITNGAWLPILYVGFAAANAAQFG